MCNKYIILYRFNNQNNLAVFELFKIANFLSFFLSITVGRNFLLKKVFKCNISLEISEKVVITKVKNIKNT